MILQISGIPLNPGDVVERGFEQGFVIGLLLLFCGVLLYVIKRLYDDRNETIKKNELIFKETVEVITLLESRVNNMGDLGKAIAEVKEKILENRCKYND